MSPPEALTDLYRELEAAHAAMLEHAERGDWDQVTEHALHSDRTLQRIKDLQDSAGAEGAPDASLKPVMEHILELTGKLQAAAGPELARLSSEIATNVQRTRVNSHYGV